MLVQPSYVSPSLFCPSNIESIFKKSFWNFPNFSFRVIKESCISPILKRLFVVFESVESFLQSGFEDHPVK